MMTTCLFLFLAAVALGDDPATAVREAIRAFNDPHQREALLDRDADLPDLSRYAATESSPLLFEAKTVRFITADVALVDAVASQYGALTFKRSWSALFVLRLETGHWKIAVLRM